MTLGRNPELARVTGEVLRLVGSGSDARDLGRPRAAPGRGRRADRARQARDGGAPAPPNASTIPARAATAAPGAPARPTATCPGECTCRLQGLDTSAAPSLARSERRRARLRQAPVRARRLALRGRAQDHGTLPTDHSDTRTRDPTARETKEFHDHHIMCSGTLHLPKEYLNDPYQ
jgi:hypothetical protein